jgi:hypothetical protein
MNESWLFLLCIYKREMDGVAMREAGQIRNVKTRMKDF